MKAIFLPLALLASFVNAAETTPASTVSAPQASSTCAAEYIVQACLTTEKAKLASCGTDNYDCSCNAYNDILTCFNNCPDDTARDDYVGEQEIYCGYASQFPSSTTAYNATSTSGQTTATPGKATVTSSHSSSGAAGTSTGTGKGTTTSTGGGVATATSNSCPSFLLNAGGMLAVAVGAVAAVL